jgi:hypothetical protein
MPVRSDLAFLPTGADGTESRLSEVARRRVTAFLEAAAGEPGTAGAQARRCLEVFSALPGDRKASLVSHPFAQQWALERAGRWRGRRTMRPGTAPNPHHFVTGAGAMSSHIRQGLKDPSASSSPRGGNAVPMSFDGRISPD